MSEFPTLSQTPQIQTNSIVTVLDVFSNSLLLAKINNVSQTPQVQSNSIVLIKLHSFSQTSQFESNFIVLVKLHSFSQTSQFQSNFIVLVKLHSFCQTSQFQSNFIVLVKLHRFYKSPQFCQTQYFLLISPKRFLFSLLMKVHTEVQYGNRLGNPKLQVSTFIHHKDMEIFNFSFFLTMQLYFPTKCFQILTG